MNDKQKGTAYRLFDSLRRTGLQQSMYALGGSGLLASSSVEDNLSPGLPDDQWELEVQNWFATSLTALQLFTVQYVTGYGSADFNKFITPPTQVNQWMCTNQIVQRSDFASFSVLGLTTILAFSGLIIVLSMSIHRIIPLIPVQSGGKQRHLLEWRAYDILHLHTADEPTATSNKPWSLSIPQKSQQGISFKQYLNKLRHPAWPFQGRVRRHRPHEPSSDSPISTTGLLSPEKVCPRTSVDTEVASTASPVSPQSVLLYGKV